MACRCQHWILQQSQQQLQIWDLSSLPAFALPWFCGWLGWAKFLLLRWRTLAHYRGSQSKMCQGIKCQSEKHLYSTASSPANGCTCLGFMCALFVCPSSHSLAPRRPSVLGPSGLRSLDGAGLIPFFQQHSCFLWEKQWPKHLTGGQRGKNANSYLSYLASIFVMKETENKSYSLQNLNLPCVWPNLEWSKLRQDMST